jgi:hypothetical protein
MLTNLPRLEDAVAKAFRTTAAIDLNFTETTTALEPTNPNTSAYPDWPDPTGQQGLDWYQLFVVGHRDTGTRWIIYYASHIVINTGTTCRVYGGAFTNTPHDANGNQIPNEVFVNAAQRFTFVFLTDIQAFEQTYCLNQNPPSDTPLTNEQWENYVIHGVTHEFGHQRAGLTHPHEVVNGQNYGTLYHQGGVPQGRADVMSYNFSDWYNHGDPVFDQNGNEQPSPYSGPTCRANLLKARSIQ